MNDKDRAEWLSIRPEIKGCLYERKSANKLTFAAMYRIHFRTLGTVTEMPVICGSCGSMNKWRLMNVELNKAYQSKKTNEQ